MITALQLSACGCGANRAEFWTPAINETLRTFEIEAPARAAAFLANVAHESGRLAYVREIWGPTAQQKTYEGRKDLGNTRPGDGYKFRGGGLIETTGRFNFAATRDGLRKFMTGVPDFEAYPDTIGLTRWASASAGWFWHEHGLNQLADAGDFDGCCDVVNRGRKTPKEGDALGYGERFALWKSLKTALGV